MKTILTFVLCVICINAATAYQNIKGEKVQTTVEVNKLNSAVFEGTITEVQSFYGMSIDGMSGPAFICIILDSYPDLQFKTTLKKGLKWGLFEEPYPGIVVTANCKGWYVKLTVNSDMEIVKCRIG